MGLACSSPQSPCLQSAQAPVLRLQGHLHIGNYNLFPASWDGSPASPRPHSCLCSLRSECQGGTHISPSLESKVQIYKNKISTQRSITRTVKTKPPAPLDSVGTLDKPPGAGGAGAGCHPGTEMTRNIILDSPAVPLLRHCQERPALRQLGEVGRSSQPAAGRRD